MCIRDRVIVATIVGNAIFLSYNFLMQYNLPRSIFVLMIIFDTIFVAGVRFGYRIIRHIRKGFYIINKDYSKRVMIIGAGDAGAMVINELNRHPELGLAPVVILDDDSSKIGRRLRGVPIKGSCLLYTSRCV